MEKLQNGVLKNKKRVVAVFFSLAVLCAFLWLFVPVNYNMADYLPENAQSTKALKIMDREFSESIPNARVMVRDVSITDALKYKDEISKIDGVSQVLWLDDAVDIKEPLQTGDKKTIENYYKNGNALFTVSIDKGMELSATEAIRDLTGKKGALADDAPDQAAMQKAAVSEVVKAVIILLPLIVLLLVLSTSSFIEPLLFLLAIGVAILINMGTNIILGDISFITQSVSPILQLAVSLDYAIFLLHSFADNREKYDDINLAMKQAMKESLSTVAASAATTMFGFAALAFMKFQIGADLGINLLKGVVISFISVMVFLPALTVLCCNLIDKTHHRKLFPDFKNVNKGLSYLRIQALILVILIIVPGFLGQRHTPFTYGNTSENPGVMNGSDTLAVNREFGQSNMIAILVPRGSAAKEKALSEKLADTKHITGVLSYASAVGTAIPPEYLGEEVLDQFYSDHYARIILYTDTKSEGEEAFATVKDVQHIISRYYDDYYTAGQSVNLYDMKNVVAKDNILVSLIAIISIFLILLLTFRSAILPILLLLTIEVGIWVNLSIPYFAGISINFIGYLVINTVQLGATVDYAILLTNNYKTRRRLLPKSEALGCAIGDSFKSILVSALVLSLAGFTLYTTSTNPIVSDLGLLLGRGTLFSLFLVSCFLPALLNLFDRAIGKHDKEGFI